MRQIPNLRRNARARPQRWQRVYFLTLNLGSRFAFAINDFFAIGSSRDALAASGARRYFFRKGIPIAERSS
jgi:hypothetical protein